MFTEHGWEDYSGWLEENNRAMLRRINRLVEDITRGDGSSGIGKPELLRGELTGWSSRRINEEHRLVYRVREDVLEIIQCRLHY